MRRGTTRWGGWRRVAGWTETVRFAVRDGRRMRRWRPLPTRRRRGRGRGSGRRLRRRSRRSWRRSRRLARACRRSLARSGCPGVAKYSCSIRTGLVFGLDPDGLAAAGSGQFVELTGEELALGVGLGEFEGAGVRRPGVAGAAGATEERGPGRVVIAVVVEGESAEEGEARLRAVQFRDRHGPVELDHR